MHVQFVRHVLLDLPQEIQNLLMPVAAAGTG